MLSALHLENLRTSEPMVLIERVVSILRIRTHSLPGIRSVVILSCMQENMAKRGPRMCTAKAASWRGKAKRMMQWSVLPLGLNLSTKVQKLKQTSVTCLINTLLDVWAVNQCRVISGLQKKKKVEKFECLETVLSVCKVRNSIFISLCKYKKIEIPWTTHTHKKKNTHKTCIPTCIPTARFLFAQSHPGLCVRIDCVLTRFVACAICLCTYEIINS